MTDRRGPALVVAIAAGLGGCHPAPRPRAPGLSTRATAAIDRVMAPVTGDRPGCAVGVARHGALVFARGYGLADLATRRPITPATVFDIGSTSKQFTAAVILSLATDGALALTDPARRYLPELPPDRGRAITLVDLMHHTSGLPDYVGLLQDRFDFADRTTTADALAAIHASRPARPPGVEEEYSNTGYFLLAQIAERVARQPFAELAHARLFAPTGMTHTAFAWQTRDPDAARGYDLDDDGAWQVATSGWEQLGDGAVHTTVGDLARWAGELERPRALPPAVITALHTRGQLDDGTALDYAGGLAWGAHAGRTTVAHAGAWVGFGAELLRFPDEGLAIACLCNFDDSDPEALALAIADAIHGE